MRDIWVISDTHFQHANILTFKESETGKLVRGHLFDNVDQMDECMMDNWNSVVKPGDLVYHLGDVFFGNKETFIKKWKLLNGSKRLVLGYTNSHLGIGVHASVEEQRTPMGRWRWLRGETHHGVRSAESANRGSGPSPTPLGSEAAAGRHAGDTRRTPRILGKISKVE